VKCHIDADSGYVRVSAVIPLDGAIEPSILLRIINSVVCFVDDFLIAKIDLLLSKEEIEVNIPEDDEIIVLTRSEMIVRFERYRDELDDHS